MDHEIDEGLRDTIFRKKYLRQWSFNIFKVIGKSRASRMRNPYYTLQFVKMEQRLIVAFIATKSKKLIKRNYLGDIILLVKHLNKQSMILITPLISSTKILKLLMLNSSRLERLRKTHMVMYGS